MFLILVFRLRTNVIGDVLASAAQFWAVFSCLIHYALLHEDTALSEYIEAWERRTKTTKSVDRRAMLMNRYFNTPLNLNCSSLQEAVGVPRYQFRNKILWPAPTACSHGGCGKMQMFVSSQKPVVLTKLTAAWIASFWIYTAQLYDVPWSYLWLQNWSIFHGNSELHYQLSRELASKYPFLAPGAFQGGTWRPFRI